MSLEPLSVPPTPPPSKSRFVLSKFAKHLSTRNRNISEFYVQPDDPWKTYFPGDSIKGTVVLTVAKPTRITHLVIRLHGYVKVYKNTVAPGEAPPYPGFLSPGRGRRGGEYFGNGFATLFEDEVVLCGEGRLKEGIYKFQFDLDLPPYSLPSSINFERGTISYMITSILTRPTTISPTMSCHRRVTVLEDIDIALFPAPKPRVVSLEPVSKRSKAKLKHKSSSVDQVNESSLLEPSSNGPSGHDHRPPLSPAPSDISGSSRLSNSSQSLQITTDPNSTNAASVRSSDVHSTTASLSEKTITATIELLRAGALPGDTLPINITIGHNKQVRSPHGIIITLYRQGRIEMYPAIPIGTPEGGKKPVYEDCLPKSRSGLSGLTLATIRTSCVFRKDLSQTFAPLMIDPVSMSATIKSSVRVPEDVFPTITHVPGSMINFRYYVEVVVDLRRKVSQDRLLPRLSTVFAGSNFSTTGQSFGVAEKSGTPGTSHWAGPVVNTDQIRREKGVIAVQFEVVVGTRDSRRSLPTTVEEQPSPPEGFNLSLPNQQPESEEWPTNESENVIQEYYDDPEYHAGSSSDHEDDDWTDYPAPGEHPLGHVIRPPQPEGPADEKTRLRREEEMLFPSWPPGQLGEGPSTAGASAPTALDLQEHDHSSSPAAPAPLSSALSLNTIVPDRAALGPGQPMSNSHGVDKRELERQRLLMEASAPNPVPSGDPQSIHAADDAPTAPVLDDDDHILGLNEAEGESLPRYQR
ncbi:hypothetical protein Egran_02710 [Elaphomyces granulatus]|uniref:Arrestin C-terminal-like domain-containing protein n=1 Tax=Elaphomyces granulatus TaxID=519963 RepID=A0A232LZD5_9EURO|nr:hypothetical protein Egran_02710 [Elaphomyces granulatus]